MLQLRNAYINTEVSRGWFKRWDADETKTGITVEPGYNDIG
jgi:hypothetical protein